MRLLAMGSVGSGKDQGVLFYRRPSPPENRQRQLKGGGINHQKSVFRSKNPPNSINAPCNTLLF
jgi:hypothetical protein